MGLQQPLGATGDLVNQIAVGQHAVALGMVLCLFTLSFVVVLAVVLYHYTSKWFTNMIRARLPVGQPVANHGVTLLVVHSANPCYGTF